MTEFIRGTNIIVKYEIDEVRNISKVVDEKGRKYPFAGRDYIFSFNIDDLIRQAMRGGFGAEKLY